MKSAFYPKYKSFVNSLRVFSNLRYLFKTNRAFFQRVLSDKWFFSWQIFVILFDGISPTLIAWLPKKFIESIESNKGFGSSFIYILFLALLNLGGYWIHSTFHNRSEILFEQAKCDTKVKLFRHNFEFLNSFYDVPNNRDVFQRAVNYADAGGVQVYNLIISFVVNIISIISMILTFKVIKPWVIIWLGVIGVYRVFIDNKLTVNSFEYNRSKTRLSRERNYYSSVLSSGHSHSELNITGGAGFFSKKYIETTNNYITSLRNHLNVVTLLKFLIFVTSPIQTIVLYAYTGIEFIKGNITFGDYTVILLSISRLELIISKVIEFPTKLYPLVLEAQNYEEYYKIDSDIEPLEAPVFEEKLYEIDSIVFANVSFAYPGSDTLALDNVSFEIRRGEFCSIVGTNGAGKSTIIKLLMKLYVPQKGHILLNGVDLNSIPRRTIWNIAQMVQQSVVKYSLSLRDNIAFGNHLIKDSQIAELLKGFNLPENKINDLDRPVTKNFDSSGIEFSGGELQKISIIRSLCRNPSLLVLDEPSSSLDYKSEEDLYSILKQKMKERITILVSHRMYVNTIADKIIYIEKGQVVNIGCHQEMMRICDGYRQLFIGQMEKFNKQV